jgi:predicted Zn-dependent protease
VQKVTKLFDQISKHYSSLGYTPPPSLQIIDSHAANAFIRHRNEVVLTRALVARVTDESELAFILAHEMAHVALGHDRGGGIPAEMEADALALKVVTALDFNPCSGSDVLERLGSPAQITLVSVTPRLHALHDQTLKRCG